MIVLMCTLQRPSCVTHKRGWATFKLKHVNGLPSKFHRYALPWGMEDGYIVIGGLSEVYGLHEDDEYEYL